MTANVRYQSLRIYFVGNQIKIEGLNELNDFLRPCKGYDVYGEQVIFAGYTGVVMLFRLEKRGEKHPHAPAIRYQLLVFTEFEEGK